ncbi:unnamed protein product [Dracunculus medinensis]|uniref:SCP domain-containing protein n=1 Tax=Dracunculus medinensis TaxID=318479 RepID=A0A0N4UBI1_DRAME|nr:unnamed protein product [Dracunculus medinensis]
MISGVVWHFVAFVYYANAACEYDRATRPKFSDPINAKRMRIAHGEDGFSGKNIYKIFYDCTFEEGAKNWAAQCTPQFSSSSYRITEGETFFATDPKNSLDELMNAAADAWYSEKNQSTSNIFTQEDETKRPNFAQVSTSAQIAWGKTSRIACAVNKDCVINGKKQDFVVCRYWPRGNIVNEKIFDEGRGCNTTADCDAFRETKCLPDQGLCINFTPD